MKKIFLSLILIIGLFGCSEKNTAAETKYYDMLKLISQREEYSTSSDNFTISAEISPISEGRYRYFVTLDKPKLAMYEVEILAIEEGKEYINEVAANAGVLLDDIYNMIPNQSDISKGYISGINISGLPVSTLRRAYGSGVPTTISGVATTSTTTTLCSS